MKAIAIAFVLTSTSASLGQPSPVPGHHIRFDLSSGLLDAPGIPIAGRDNVLVWEQEILVPGAQWIQLSLEGTILSGDVAARTGSTVVITSLLDGDQQQFHAESLEEWQYWSGYFNGDSALVQLFAHPGTSFSRVNVSLAHVGDPLSVVPPFQPETICGPENRTAYNDPRVARLVANQPGGGICFGTAWMIGSNSLSNEFLTAGHNYVNPMPPCLPPTASFVHFNVPRSFNGGLTTVPPIAFQFAIQQTTSLQATNPGTSIGNDAAHFLANANTPGTTTTNLPPRIVQGNVVVPLLGTSPNVASPPQNLTVTGYGATIGVNPASNLPPRNNFLGKTDTGPYVSRVLSPATGGAAGTNGIMLSYQVDTTGGNSGSPIILATGTNAGSAIGIHTNGGCANPVATPSNSGTGIDWPTLQGFIANPMGTQITHNASSELFLSTMLISNANAGPSAVGDSIYFDLTTGPNPIRVNGFWLNVGSSATPTPPATSAGDDYFTFNVFLTNPAQTNTHVGNETNQNQWTLAAVGGGMPNPTNSPLSTALGLPGFTWGGLTPTPAGTNNNPPATQGPFTIPAYTQVGVAISFVPNNAVLLPANTVNVRHAYTTGTGTGGNQTHTVSNASGQTALTLVAGSTTTTPFGGTLTNNVVVNGGPAFTILPLLASPCITTLFDTTTAATTLPKGGVVFFDVTPAIGRTITVTGFELNTSAPVGQSVDIAVYKTPTGYVGKEMNESAWTLRAEGNGTSAGPGVPTNFVLDQFFDLAAGTQVGMAVRLTYSNIGSTNGLVVTPGTGSNLNYMDNNLMVMAGATTTEKFAGTLTPSRVPNGTMCYAVNVTSAASKVLPDPVPWPNPRVQAELTNNATGVPFDQHADLFTTGSKKFKATGAIVWGVYRGTGIAPVGGQAIDLTVFGHSIATGFPGLEVGTRNVAGITPQPIGLIQSGNTPPRPMYQFDIPFTAPMILDADTPYWLSPLGKSANTNFSWQQSQDAGGHARKTSTAGAWVADGGEMAFAVCGEECSRANCAADCNEDCQINIMDYVCFGDAYASADPYADMDGNGVFTIFDYIEYGNLYVAGCP